MLLQAALGSRSEYNSNDLLRCTDAMDKVLFFTDDS